MDCRAVPEININYKVRIYVKYICINSQKNLGKFQSRRIAIARISPVTANFALRQSYAKQELG